MHLWHLFSESGTVNMLSLFCPFFLEVVGRVPDWMCLPLTQARFSGDILDVLLLQRLTLSTPVDHADKPSASLTSRPLRQVLYGLLLGSRNPSVVQERDREGLQLKVIPVQRVFKGVIQRLALNSLDKVKLLGFLLFFVCKSL